MPSPLVLLALAFAAGIALVEGLGPPAVVSWSLLGASTVALVWTWVRSGRWGLAAMAQALALGGLMAQSAWPQAPAGLLGGGPWQVTARVEDVPDRSFGQVHLLVKLDEVVRDGVARSASGRVWLRLGGAPIEPLLPGDRVAFRAQLKPAQGFAEPDAPDPARRPAERGVIAVAGVPTADGVARLAGGEQRSLTRAVAAWRRQLLEDLPAWLVGDRRALLESLVLGERAHVPPDLDDAFRVAGVSHVLSVSGLHLAMAAALFFLGLRRLLVRITPLARRVAVLRLAALAALPATALYTLLTGASVATVRACVVAWVWLLGAALGRPPTAGAALATAALILLGDSPLTLYDPSFQLSFAAAIGVVLVAPRLVPPSLTEHLRSPSPGVAMPWARRAARWLARQVVRLVAASAAAILATGPIAAYHFGQVAPAGLLTNVVVVPLAELWVVPAGLTACVVSSLSGTLAAPLFWVAGVGAAAMARLVRALASLPHVAALGKVPPPTLLEAAAWYLGLTSLALLGWRRAWKVAATCAAILALSIAARAAWPRLHPSLTVTFLDVGQGDACLVELPDGRTLLVDGGGSFDPSFDPGAQLIVPWLERHGVRRLDVVALTHPHPDHANGLAAVVAHFPVGEVWTNGAPSRLPSLLRLQEEAARRHIPVLRPHALDGPARVTVLHPLVGGEVVAPPPAWSENDGSVVLRVEYAGRAVLLTGDVEARAERLLVAGAAAHPLAADVLKAPHHGSRTSSTAPLVAAVRPSVVVFSVGSLNRWSFPAAEVDARWRATGATTYRTDRDGAVTVKIGPRGSLDVTPARRRRRGPD